VQQPGSLLARDSYTSFSITSLVSQLGSTGASPSEALCPKPVPGSPSWLRYASRQLVQPPEGAKQIPVQVQRILFRPETCLEMGPANALRASFAQAGPKEVLRASAAHSSGRSCSV